ncbi:MBL fold metallo-hydrolase [bacterium]|nr:MBL fold metallo-hydrolase [bacterium]
MEITCRGSRGALPVCGKEFLKYGGETTCVEVTPADGTRIILDAGSGIQHVHDDGARSSPQHWHLLFTHAHLDHLLGLIYFQPVFDPNAVIEIYGPPLQGQPFETVLSSLISPPFSPITLAEMNAEFIFHEVDRNRFRLGTADVLPIPLNHPGGGRGYAIISDNKKFVFLTDNELDFLHEGGASFPEYAAFCEDADLLFHDAEYTQPEYARRKGWGHSCTESVIRLAWEAKVKRLGLFHHGRLRTDAALDAILTRQEELIRAQKPPLRCSAVAAGHTTVLQDPPARATR